MIVAKFEKEIKVLNIDVEETISKLNEIGAKDKGRKDQKIYTYDIPTIYYRCLEIKDLLKTNNDLLINVLMGKLSVLLDEFEDLIDDNTLDKICNEMKLKEIKNLLSLKNQEILEKFESSKTFNNIIEEALINPNKWIRLRKSNDKVELTVKHIYQKSKDKIQKVKEYEIAVSDFDETNKILTSIGIIRRNYQEKIRHSFQYKNADIEIDIWPHLEPYMEIECDDENTISEILKELQFENKEIVSVNTEQLYKRKNIDVLKISDLKF